MLGSPVNIQLIEKANGSAQAAQRLRAGVLFFFRGNFCAVPP